VIDGLTASVPDCDVLVVDDGSTDDTAVLAREAGAAVVTLPFNLGIGGALRTGFLYAVRHGYDRGVQFDGDGQHDPSQIKLLIEALDAGADMVTGNRFGGETHTYEVGRVRARAMGVLRFMVRQLSGQSFADTSTGFRAFSRPVLEYFALNYPYEYLESVEALVLACAQGFRVDEVPVRMNTREGGTPSTRRFRLLYHYVRLLLVITATAGRKPIREGNALREGTAT
jgi:glycosyltransferase involved in cell wall biosynthesis